MAHDSNMSRYWHMRRNSYDSFAWACGERRGAQTYYVDMRICAGHCAFPLQPNLETVRSFRLFDPFSSLVLNVRGYARMILRYSLLCRAHQDIYSPSLSNTRVYRRLSF